MRILSARLSRSNAKLKWKELHRPLSYLYILSLSVFAAPSAHALYTQEGVITSGGGISTSSGYENLGTVGLMGAGGTSANYKNLAGFIQVLGAEGALYPIIGATPGSFTFTMSLGVDPAGQGLSITNQGGSTLAWSVGKGQAWLTLNSLDNVSGTNAGTVTVGIKTAGLIVGNYQDTITITATGADAVTIPVALTVNASGPPVLTVNLAGTGGGNVNSDLGFTCSSTTPGQPTTCEKNDLSSGQVVNLMVSPDAASLFAGWSGACSGLHPLDPANNNCRVTMNGNQSVTATFDKQKPVRRVDSSGTPQQYYDSLQLAYNEAQEGDVIQLMEGRLAGTLDCNRAVRVWVRGGYDAAYSSNSGSYTVIGGKSLSRLGTVRFDRVKVK